MELANVEQRARSLSDPGDIVRIDYINYRGERGIRRVIPETAATWAKFAGTQALQWILDAWDVDKGALRSFAIADIQCWGV